MKARRLARIRSILIANEDTRSLSDIAVDFGFSFSGGHFSREFHKQFGFSPSEIRANRAAPPIADQPVESPLDTIFRMLHP